MTVYVIEGTLKELGVITQLAIALDKNMADNIAEAYKKKADIEIKVTEYTFDSYGMIIFD